MTIRARRPAPNWHVILAVFWVTQLVESLGVSQVFALLPTYLRELGVSETDRLPFIGLFGSLVFVLGLPLVPLWGVWADKYSRKVVIVRSCLVEVVVFGLAALAREPWQMAVAVLLIGFQLGNTGVMLAGIRDVVPRHRVGTSIALFGAAGPVGFAVGPVLAAVLIDGAGWSVSGVFALSAVFSIGTALLVSLGTHEVRPEVIPVGPVLRLAFGAVRGVLGDRDVRRLFVVYGVVFLANQVSRPYTPVLVEGLVGTGVGLASAIGLVMGVASLVGALASPAAGWAGDPDRAQQQARGQGRQDPDCVDAHRREPPGSGRALPAGVVRGSGTRPVAEVHGYQPQGDLVLSDLAVLLGGDPGR